MNFLKFVCVAVLLKWHNQSSCLFCVLFYSELWKLVRDMLFANQHILINMIKSTSFLNVAAGTGVPFHFHGPGFGEVVFGRKVKI